MKSPPPARHVQPHQSIALQFIAYLMVLSVIPLLVLGISAADRARELLYVEAQRHTLQLLRDQRDYLELRLDQVEALLASLAGQEAILAAADAAPNPGDVYARLATQAQIGYILNHYLNLKGLVSIALLMPGGGHYQVGDTLDAGVVDPDAVNRLFQSAIHQSDRPVWWAGLERNINVNASQPQVVTAAKVLWRMNRQTLVREPVALLLANFSVDELYRQFHRLDLGENAVIYLIDQQNRFIYHPDRAWIGHSVANGFRCAETEETRRTDRVTGEPALISQIAIPRVGWCLESRIPDRTLAAKAEPIQHHTALLLIACLGVVGVGAWWYSRRVVQPIRTVIHGFQSLSTNHFDPDTRLAVTRRDEIGALIRGFNTFLDTWAMLRAREAQLRTLINGMPDIVCFKDGDGRWLEANTFGLNLFGLQGVAYQGKTDSELASYSPFCREAFLQCEATDELAWRQRAPHRSDERIPQPDGTEKVFDVIKIPQFAATGRRQGLVVVGRDVTERQRVEAALSVSERRFRAMIEHAPDGIVLFNQTIRYASPSVYRLLGYTPEEAADINPDHLTHPEDLPPLLSLLHDLRQKPGQVVSTRYRFRHKNCSWRWVESTISNLLAEPSVGAMVFNFRDITERQQAEARLRLAAAVFDAARDAILVMDATGRIVAVNPAFTTLTGYAEADVRGRTPRLLWAERQPKAYFQALWRIVTHEGVWQGEFWARRQDGERRAAMASLGVVRDAADQITHYVGVATDITALKVAEQRIEHLAYYDALTDLPNRALLAQRAELALALAARHRTELALLFFDLDRFKEINDALGHVQGDALLAQVALRFQAVIRAEDTLCRLGGDEFVLLLPDVGQEGALRVTSKLRTAFREPFVIAGHSLPVTGSVGIALYPHDGADFAELLKNADAALHRAKQEGRNTWVFYAPAMNVTAFERLMLEGELRQAIENGQLRAYYQPKVRLSDGAMIGAEALVRWQHPAHGLIPPGQFIPVAEASDLIVALGDWMLAEVCRQLAVWREAGLAPLTVAVNLAARHFREPQLAPQIQDLLTLHGLSPHTLELELTESTLLETGGRTMETLHALERLGVGLALDDFGTGYSSLGYLKRLPLTALKIDQSFVRDLATDADDRTLAATIVALGHSLGLQVVAEGVETEDQRGILCEQGCDLAQGYLFSRPLPAAAFAAGWAQAAPAEE